MAALGTNVNYHEVSTGDNAQCYVKSKDIDPITMKDVLTTAGSVLVPAVRYVYKEMVEKEFDEERAYVGTVNKSVVCMTKGTQIAISEAKRLLIRKELGVPKTAVGVFLLDGFSIIMSVIEDGGKIGRSTVLNVRGLLGDALATGIGFAISCYFDPVIGNAIGQFLGRLLASLIVNGITKLYLAYCPVVPGPGPPLMDVDPFATAFGAPRMEQEVEPYDISQDTPAGAFGFPDMGHDVEQEFPEMNYDTR